MDVRFWRQRYLSSRPLTVGISDVICVARQTLDSLALVSEKVREVSQRTSRKRERENSMEVAACCSSPRVTDTVSAQGPGQTWLADPPGRLPRPCKKTGRSPTLCLLYLLLLCRYAVPPFPRCRAAVRRQAGMQNCSRRQVCQASDVDWLQRRRMTGNSSFRLKKKATYCAQGVAVATLLYDGMRTDGPCHSFCPLFFSFRPSPSKPQPPLVRVNGYVGERPRDMG